MSHDARVDVQSLLSAFPFVAELSTAGRQRLAAEAHAVCAQAGQLLVRRGDPVSGAYLVLEGCLRVYTINDAGREATLYWVERGESCILALRCVFSELEYPAWVQAESDAKWVVVAAGAFRHLFTQEPALQRFVFDTLSSRIFSLMATLDEVLGSDVQSRLAGFLLRRADERGRVEASHETIAAHLGTAREVVSRGLRQLEQAGLVRRRRAVVEVLDRERLGRTLEQ